MEILGQPFKDWFLEITNLENEIVFVFQESLTSITTNYQQEMVIAQRRLIALQRMGFRLMIRN